MWKETDIKGCLDYSFEHLKKLNKGHMKVYTFTQRSYKGLWFKSEVHKVNWHSGCWVFYMGSCRDKTNDKQIYPGLLLEGYHRKRS